MPARRAFFQGDPRSARFVAGGLAEAESLFGSPLPLLPPAEFENERAVFFVHTHPRLKTLLQRHLQALMAQIGVEVSPQARGRQNLERDQEEYEAALLRILASARDADRRLGLLNLFWLAHSREATCILKELEARNAAVRKLKYSLHPLLSSFYRRLEQASRREFERASKEHAATIPGTRENPTLIEAVIEDGFAFTEASIQAFDFNQFLAANKRYRIAADVFFEIYQVLLRETERRVRESDRGLVQRIQQHMPLLPKETWSTQQGIVKIMMNAHVMTYLFGDAWNVGTKLMAGAKLQGEAQRRRPAEIVDAFLDVVSGVKRFEVVSGIRDSIVLLEDKDLDLSARRNRRVYEFSESATVLNNAVNATVLFLDLRGFTKTSEGQISERDLTRELYTVFDAFAPHVRRFGGTIDKFLGDGIMVTFGTEHVDPLDPLNALRVAILCQETLSRLRETGKTVYKMGIAIHYGRVYLARFIADEETTQQTVIGRNVNLAGRLSSAARKPMEEDQEQPKGASPQFPPPRPSGLQTVVDKAGTLFNEGIAISRDTLVQLEAHLPLVHTEDEDEESTVLEYFDESIGRRILIRYAGDAKFKGVRSSFPVYEVDYEV
ncbi:MAG TPA: adenylate/guanylate cyclase domain-containing protein [Vicinamibacteria bacterium]|nr:adenylate/guanylate cyclase domain-containing protein [Vicinamibacteria bacterium]